MEISKMSQENKDKGRSVLDALPGWTQERLNDVAKKAHEKLMAYLDEEGAVTNGEVVKVLLSFEDREEMAAAGTYMAVWMAEQQNPFASLASIIGRSMKED